MNNDQGNFTSSGLRGASKEAAAEQKKVKSAFKGNVGVTPSAPLDEARMREILGREAHMAGIGLPFDTEAHERSVLAAMSRAISEARAEQRERDARIVDGLIVKGPLSGNGWDKSAERNGVVLAYNAIRSQDDPDKQGE